MRFYFNPSNDAYQELLNSPIIVDKSLLIEKLNRLINTSNKNICISRPRRFGKTTDANMLVAYYSKGCDSHSQFDGKKIAGRDSYEEHINKHNVIHLNMQGFLSRTHTIETFIQEIYNKVVKDLKKVFPNDCDESDLESVLEEVCANENEKFIFVVDEWDCIFREFKEDKESQKKYLDYLRSLFKDRPYVELVYMTGILPIKKYGTHSALNMFNEISMLDADVFSEFMGFTEGEVETLCRAYDVDFDKMKEWYDGYCMIDGIHTYSPRSVVVSINRKRFSNYWSQTETYEALKAYIDLNYDGLKDDIIDMMAGNEVSVRTTKFQNDMSTFASKDDVLTLLIHLGYLGYRCDEKKAYIPNNEVKDTFIDSVSDADWGYTTRVFQNSVALLEATWNGQEERVAHYIEESHYETSILQYNDENALSYTINLAYIAAGEYYTIVRELPTGKGFSEIAFIPRGNKPAMLVELKWNQDAETALTQIRQKHYPRTLEKYKDNLLLVAINYDKDTKEHICKIEKYRDL